MVCRETVAALEAEADGGAEAQGVLDDLETQVLRCYATALGSRVELVIVPPGCLPTGT